MKGVKIDKECGRYHTPYETTSVPAVRPHHGRPPSVSHGNRWGQQPTAIVCFQIICVKGTRAPLLSPPFLLHLSRLPREGSFPCYSCLPRFRCCCGSTTLEASFAQCVSPLGLCPAASNMDDAHTMPTQTAGNLTLVPFAIHRLRRNNTEHKRERHSPSSSTSVWGGKLVKQREAREQPNKRQLNCTNLGTTALFFTALHIHVLFCAVRK